MNIFDYTVKAQDGSDFRLADLKGKVLLVVNTATECGFTPQYANLQEIYKDLKDKGLEILDFPCNQFGEQAPGTNDEIHTFCTGRFGVTFPQFSKIDVNGENADPLYKCLTSETVFTGFEGEMGDILDPIVVKMDPDYKTNGNIKWNFTKFLIGKDGNIVERFEPTASLERVKASIEKIL